MPPMSVRTQLLNPLSALDDRALLTRFAEQHDQGAFEQLVKRHGRLVFGVCRRVVRDVHLAEDAFQAVFLVLARNPNGAAGATSVGGWLFGTARRVGLAARRHEQRRERRERRAGQPETDAPAPGSELNDLLCVLDEELAALPDDVRAALVACFLEEHTQDEAARELGWSVSTLRRRLDRGKELLRARLARRGVTLGAGLLAGALARPARAAVPALGRSPLATALADEVLKSGLGLKLHAAVVAAVLAVGGLACGFAGEADEPPGPLPQPPVTNTEAQAQAVARAPAPHAIERKLWATVSGRIVFPKDQRVPGPRPVPVGQIKDADQWKPFGPVLFEEVLIDPDSRGIANVMVWLRPDSDDLKAAFPADKIHPKLRAPAPQEHTVLLTAAQFRPRILAVRAGDAVAFTNQFGVASNVHYTTPNDEGDKKRGFNRLSAPDMTLVSKPLPADHAPDMFRSTIHNWMRGFVRAFDHPYFAVTDANGRFELKDVPAGRWRVVAWHEEVGYLHGGPVGRLGTKLTVPETRTGKHDLGSAEFASERWPAP